MIYEHATVFTCSCAAARDMLFPSFINCLILSCTGWLHFSLREREGGKTTLSASNALPIGPSRTVWYMHILPYFFVKISNRSRYSSSTASGRSSLIITSRNDYMDVLLKWNLDGKWWCHEGSEKYNMFFIGTRASTILFIYLLFSINIVFFLPLKKYQKYYKFKFIFLNKDTLQYTL